MTAIKTPIPQPDCSDLTSTQVTVENCYDLLTAAKRRGMREVQDQVYRYMSAHFLQVLRSPAAFGRLSAGERELILRRRMEGRKVLSAVEDHEVFERGASGPPSRPQSPSSSVPAEESRRLLYYLDPDTKEWEVLGRMPEEVSVRGSGICTMFNYLFVAGGIKTHGEQVQVSDQVFCYNPLTNTWDRIRPLRQARSQFRLVSMDGCLFAIGGECLFSVERYDPRADRWSHVAPLPGGAFAVAHAATSCGGDLFVSGGSLFFRLLRYDARRDEWEECPFNDSRRKSADMVAYKSFIYRFDVSRQQRGVHVCKYNTVLKVWHESASYRLENVQPFRCAVLGDRIYCVGRSRILIFQVEEGEEEKETFLPDTLPAPAEAKGALTPFVLTVPKTN
ncbi:kelch repeat and BTB domain-containing protein 11-like [Lampris incognitus]|uniref:kelch repeat and BTB domain-containing protein 11-like n=1 Tax=Lampris incognitus TaxID=2546036 RepID=UPI0024B4D2F1|nr:kelch repeat and BTB domain-containing protein 11-like [Lampris incognitus]